MRCHSCIFDHFEKGSPNQSSAENILDLVDSFHKEIERNWVNDVLHEGMILKVQEDCFVLF